MRFTIKLEEQILEALRTTPDACITLPERAYRPDGALMIHRRNRSFRLHRYLSEQLGHPIARGVYLHPNCKTAGCQNPGHFIESRRSTPGRIATECPNGHPYTDANTLPEGRLRCRTCRDARNARRRTGARGGGYCGKGLHPLTPGNVYVSTDVSGRMHRRCKPCTIERMRKRRQHDGAAGPGEGTARGSREADQRAGAVQPVHRQPAGAADEAAQREQGVEPFAGWSHAVVR